MSYLRLAVLEVSTQYLNWVFVSTCYYRSTEEDTHFTVWFVQHFSMC